MEKNIWESIISNWLIFHSFFTGQDDTLIFQGGVFVDASIVTVGRNGKKLDQLDDKNKKDIENVLNDEFCSADFKVQAKSNTCSIQNLEFRVKKN